MMDPRDHWARVRDAFARLEATPADARADLLASLDPVVRADVESLRHAGENAPAFLMLSDEAPGAGTTIGPYQVTGELGRGGMGAVYRAERRDGEFTRSVAIKIAAGQGFAPEAERRFIQERQILAQLDHPHIVRLLDGGVTSSQRYLVMELAEGTPLPKYCRDKRLRMAAKLRLFRDACSAIHYAHQRLILHRDLKAGNIVVTDDGVVKVLDFGIAQLMRADETGPAADATTMRAFSLSCASPEQFRGERLSPASDIYALGVLLFELLTGVNPQYQEGDGFDRVYRRVIEELTPRPTAAARRVSRDLDAIVLKAMAKAPGDRYASVAELDADVERYLGGRTVLAVPPRPSYVVSRFIRRNRALTLVVAALVVVATVGATLYVRQARRERRRFEDARKLVHTVIFEIQPKLAAVSGTLPLRKTLVEGTMSYLESVSKDADDVGLLMELSKAYVELARVMGDPSISNLGHAQSATEWFARADTLMQRALARAPNDAALLDEAANFYARLAGDDGRNDREEVMSTHAQMGVTYAERLIRIRPDDRTARSTMAFALFFRAVAVANSDERGKQVAFRQAADLYRQLVSEKPEDESSRRNLAITLRYVASLSADLGDFTAAVGAARESVDSLDALSRKYPLNLAARLDLALGLRLLATWQDDAGDPTGAIEPFERALLISEAALKADPGDAYAADLVADTARAFALCQFRMRNYARSRQLAQRALALYEGVKDPPNAEMHRVLALTLTYVGDLDWVEGNKASACRSYATARAHHEARRDIKALGAAAEAGVRELVQRQTDRCGIPPGSSAPWPPVRP